MWFKIDIKKLAVLLTPTMLRKPVLLALLTSLVRPLESIYYNWSAFRTDNIYKLSHNSQVCYLRKALNDRFDSQLRRIEIKGAELYEKKYIYTKEELKPRWLGTIYLRRDEDYEDKGIDFIVEVPFLESEFKRNYELKALVDFYKLASKRYRVEYSAN